MWREEELLVRIMRALGIAMSVILLASCASTPAPLERADARDWAHQQFFADVISVLSAMGGNNPNKAYRSLMSQACVSRPQSLQATQRSSADRRCATLAALPRTAPKDCQRHERGGVTCYK